MRMRNDNIERCLILITVLLIIIVALLIPILAKADASTAWVPAIPATPLLMTGPTDMHDPTPTPTPQLTPTPGPPDDELIRSVITEAEEKKLAQTIYGEDRNCGGPDDTMKQAAVIWSIFNRCDAWGKSVDEIITHSQYHGWFKNQKHPEWAHVLVRDVAVRWAKEKRGETDVGRVLPKEYLFFANGGEHERFRTGYRTKDYWDWSLENPYRF